MIIINNNNQLINVFQSVFWFQRNPPPILVQSTYSDWLDHFPIDLEPDGTAIDLEPDGTAIDLEPDGTAIDSKSIGKHKVNQISVDSGRITFQTIFFHVNHALKKNSAK